MNVKVLVMEVILHDGCITQADENSIGHETQARSRYFLD
jgi:hypothetical protein